MSSFRMALWAGALFWASAAAAEPDTFGLGTGRSGFLRIDSGSRVVNRYARLTASATAGTRELTVSSTAGFSVGELVLIHQSQGLTPVPASGDQRRLSLDSSTVGRFEYARVEAVPAGALTLTAPLMNSYPRDVTQVVSVPEYTDLEVRTGATLLAQPWDGSVGGILAVLVSGRLRNDGLITVDGAGLRGGAFLDHEDRNGCSSLDEPSASGGSYKGEGLVAGRYGTASGRGNGANGGGGGNCHNAGGGGGGHGGMGGAGGRSSPGDGTRDMGGMGGAALVYLPYERLVFGGGGGAGEGNDGLGTGGGAGGGLMLIRAQEVRGSGSFRANGATPPPTPGDDGAGGGGAGGAISMRAMQEIECGAMEAQGGAGGDSSETGFSLGPGGGGGGGVVFLQTPTPQCPTLVKAGAAGQDLATGTSNGAGPSSVSSAPAVGSVQSLTSAFRLPATPTLTQPADGETGVSSRPRIQGTAEAGARVHLFVDGVPAVRVEAGADGLFQGDVSVELGPGPHTVSASAEVLGVRSAVSAPRSFQVAGPQDDGGTPDGGSAPDGGSGPPGSQVTPILVVPAEGERVGPTPVFTGTGTPGAWVSLAVDDAELSRVRVEADGRFRYALTSEQALTLGVHVATARAVEGVGSADPGAPRTSFEVVAVSLEPGCGCGASSGAGWGAGVLLGMLWRLRRRTRLPRPL